MLVTIRRERIAMSWYACVLRRLFLSLPDCMHQAQGIAQLGNSCAANCRNMSSWQTASVFKSTEETNHVFLGLVLRTLAPNRQKKEKMNLSSHDSLHISPHHCYHDLDVVNGDRWNCGVDNGLNEPKLDALNRQCQNTGYLSYNNHNLLEKQIRIIWGSQYVISR